MTRGRRILVADPDPASGRALAAALRRRGFHVQLARDGARALELALLRTPDLVVLDAGSPLVDAATFAHVLAANPRTARVPVLLGGAPAVGVAAGPPLAKPWDAAAVLARVEETLRRSGATTAAARRAGLEGDLGQLPLPDLLQALAVNRRTGTLSLRHGSARGEVALEEGRVAGAALGRVTGEKALFRLLAWREGHFAFAAGRGTGARAGARAVEELLLDGLRQADELASLRPAAPGPSELLALAVAPGDVGEGLHPAAAGLVALLRRRPRTLPELLDGAPDPDLDLVRALLALLERGVVRRRAAAPAAPAPALAAEVADALRARLGRGPGASPAAGKVVLAGGGPLARRSALARLAALPGFSPEPGGAPVELGTLGRLEAGPGLRMDLVALPGDPALAPLWRPLAAGALGALVLAPAEEVAAEIAALARALRLPLGMCAPSPEARGAALAHVPWLAADPAEALPRLLALAAGAAPRSIV